MKLQEKIEFRWLVASAIGALLLGGLGTAPLTAAITFGGNTYATGTSTEILNAPFNSPTGTQTVNKYAGYILISVTGTGDAQGTNKNDAFYVYTDAGGNPVTPSHDPNYYQLRYSTAAMSPLQPQFDAYKFIVFDASTNTAVTPPYTPTYQPSHTYSFAVPVPGFAPSNLFFGTSDGIFNDNNGSYVVTITQLVAQPVISKAFSSGKIPAGGTTGLSFTITNADPGNPLTNVSFTDTLPAPMTVTAPVTTPGVCNGGTLSGTGGSISLAGASLPAVSFCTFTFNTVTAPEGSYTNTVTASATGAGASLTSAPATASLIAATSPVLSKVFGEVSIGALGSTSLTFTLTNPDHTLTLHNLSFSDTLPAGLVVSTPNGLTGTCGGGTITATAGSNTVTVSGTMLTPGTNCTFSVNVSSDGTVLGLLTNTTSTVTSTEALPGAAASAVIFIGDPFQVSYAANLNIGESYLGIANTGTNGASLQGPGFGAPSGNICVNVYAFDPAEELISCCSCLITPDQTVNLGVTRDLTAKTLTGVVPTSVTVKLLATLAGPGGTGSTCTNTAATATLATIANGMAAWGTTLHPTPTTGSYATTERAFTGATLSAGELASITGRCAAVIGNGSGFGVCSSCKSGALGASNFPE